MWEYPSPPFFPSLVFSPFFPYFLPLFYLWYPGEGAGGVLGPPLTHPGPPPTVPQRTPQQWRLQGVAKRPSRRPSEGIVEPSGLENDVKMSSQSNISVPFRRLGCKSEINALATVSARFWRSEGTQKCYHIAHKSMRHKVKTKPEGKSTLKSTSGGLR